MTRGPVPHYLPTDAITAIIDTREQIPLNLDPLSSVPGTLTTGDYSVRGLERIVAVERKSLTDLLGCCGSQRERFDREIMRLLAYPWRLLIVEATWPQIDEGRWPSKITVAAVRNSLLSWMGRGIPVLLAGTHQRAGEYAREFLCLAARSRWAEARGIIHPAESQKSADKPAEVCPF